MTNASIERQPDPTCDPRTRRFVNPVRVEWPAPVPPPPAGSEHLLTARDGQATVWQDPVCVLSLGADGKDDAPALLLDFGRELHGGLQIVVVTAPDNKPVRMRVRFGESVSEVMGSPMQDHAIHDHLTLLPWAGQHELGNTAFRFVRLDLVDSGTWVGLRSVRAVSLMREDPWVGAFTCSDERLNRVWNTGAYTVQLCMQDLVWDGAKRDRLVWIGDIHPETSVISAVWGRHPVAEQSLDFARNEATPASRWMNGFPTYSLWWIVVQRDWYRAHGHLSYLLTQREYLLNLVAELLTHVDDEGCEKLPARFTDWSSAGDDAALQSGCHALMVMALNAAAQLGEVLGESDLTRRCTETVARMRLVLPPKTANKQAHALRVLAGLATAVDVNRDVLSQDPLAGLSTFYGYYILQARAAAGDYVGCLDTIRRYWGAMLDLGATTFWEHFDVSWLANNPARIDEVPQEGRPDIHADFGDHCYRGHRHSLCHGWAAGPTAWLSEHVLGVSAVTPGFSRVRIAPQLGDLAWARGTIPTPQGPIQVSHERGPGGAVRSSVQLPTGVLARRSRSQRLA